MIKERKSASEWFSVASNLDSNGKEANAKLAYEQVLKAGVHRLPIKHRRFFYLQYGSTLRNCGEYAKAESVLRKGIALYPDFLALKLFLALVQISQKKNLEACKTLFKVLLDDRPDRSIKLFERALRHYIKTL